MSINVQFCEGCFFEEGNDDDDDDNDDIGDDNNDDDDDDNNNEELLISTERQAGETHEDGDGTNDKGQEVSKEDRSGTDLSLSLIWPYSQSRSRALTLVFI